ncbi:hypothetical protein CLPU_3c02670 [Gottschalkia purinilytica]|uniref:DUF3899 domain-containing protein n=1 Tax=Gottschalkia purinilytica TaxID=1503 RepID=A0A0L0WDE2_GOTPU|nr:hypothetical protein [Gottschalkia purinilytica]KNF09487.1 hypothetical protein CLPU_3c02670 [Gottschalkia purinilytica]
MKKAVNYFKGILYSSIIISIITTLICYILNIKNFNLVILSDYFFIEGIVIIILGAVSKILSWSIHKKHSLNRFKGDENSLIEAKYKLNNLFKILGVVGILQILVSLILAMIVIS